MEKRFPLASVLSITTNRLVCPIDGVYEILSHMAGDDVYTHQIGRCMKECAPWLLRWFPSLKWASSPEAIAELDVMLKEATGDRMDAVGKWVDMIATQHALPRTYMIGRIPVGDHESINPVAELEAMTGKTPRCHPNRGDTMTNECHDDCPMCAAEPTTDMRRYLPTFKRFSAATRSAHARALEAYAASVLDLSDADLAELTERALDTPRAKADIANGSAGGIRPEKDGGQ